MRQCQARGSHLRDGGSVAAEDMEIVVLLSSLAFCTALRPTFGPTKACDALGRARPFISDDIRASSTSGQLMNVYSSSFVGSAAVTRLHAFPFRRGVTELFATEAEGS